VTNCFFLTAHAHIRFCERTKFRTTLGILELLSEMVWHKKYTVLTEKKGNPSSRIKIMHKPSLVLFVFNEDLSSILTVNPKPINQFKKRRVQCLL